MSKKKYNKLLEKSKNIHDSLINEINHASKKNKKTLDKNIEQIQQSIKIKHEKVVKELDKKIQVKKSQISKLNKKVESINKLTNNLDQEKFMDELKEIKSQTVKLLKEKLGKIEEFKENQTVIYDKEYERLSKKCKETMDEAKQDINDSFNL